MPNEHLTVRETPIRVGDKAPDFTLPDQDRKDVTLSEHLKAGKTVVLSFFPMAFTSVCGTEMGCFTRDLGKFKEKNTVVLGVSCDSFATLKAWSEAEGIKATMLADMHRAVCRAYGMYFAPLNVAGRGTVVIGPDGVVKWVEARELKDAVKNEDVLAAIS
ncbi:MAG: redoxin domain-containing protein [Phycisphaerales bacterium]